jgi:F0F1-type ATP synthase delta subunit
MGAKISHRTLAKTIARELVDAPERRQHWIKMLAAYLVENNLTDRSDAIINDVAREIFARNGDLLVSVTSARPLTAGLRDDIKQLLRHHTGAKHVILDESVDPSVLGGILARTPDAELDLTVRSKLKQLASL